MHASEVLTKNEMRTLWNWFKANPDRIEKMEACVTFEDIQDLIPKCSEYNGIAIYRGLKFDNRLDTDLVRKIFTSKITTKKDIPCESWSSDRETAISVSKYGSMARFVKDIIKSKPSGVFGFTFKRKVTSKDCLLPIPALFDLDWSGLGRFKDMIEFEKRIDEKEFIMRNKPLNSTDLTHMYVNELSHTTYMEIENVLPFPYEAKNEIESIYAQAPPTDFDVFVPEMWVNIDFEKSTLYLGLHNTEKGIYNKIKTYRV